MSHILSIQNDHMSEYSGLYGQPVKSLFELARSRYSGEVKQTPFVLFTDPIETGNGEKLYELLKSMGVGKVWESEVRLNPNSHNELKIYIFCPDDKALHAWADPRIAA